MHIPFLHLLINKLTSFVMMELEPIQPRSIRLRSSIVCSYCPELRPDFLLFNGLPISFKRNSIALL